VLEERYGGCKEKTHFDNHRLHEESFQAPIHTPLAPCPFLTRPPPLVPLQEHRHAVVHQRYSGGPVGPHAVGTDHRGLLRLHQVHTLNYPYPICPLGLSSSHSTTALPLCVH
jgi:hypothetical protein